MNNLNNNKSESLVFTLLESASLVEKRIDGALSCIRGISFSEYRLLRCLSQFHNYGAMRVDLAKAVGLTPSAVTRALKPLEKIGYVNTEKSERDARKSLAQLTEAGKTLLSDAETICRDVICDLPISELDYDQLIKFRDGISYSKNTP